MPRKPQPQNFDDLRADDMRRRSRSLQDRQQARIDALERALKTTKINWDEEAQRVSDENPAASYRESLTADLQAKLKQADVEYERARRSGLFENQKPENE